NCELISTAGNPKAPGSRLEPEPAIPPLSSQNWLVKAVENEAKSESRLLVTKRQFPPNCTVCLPRVQVRSSLKVCTGTFTISDRVNERGLSKKRKVMWCS